jgi:hypothetical protein
MITGKGNNHFQSFPVVTVTTLADGVGVDTILECSESVVVSFTILFLCRSTWSSLLNELDRDWS